MLAASREPLNIVDEIEKLLTILTQTHARLRQLYIECDSRSAVILAADASQNNEPAAKEEGLCGIVRDKDDRRFQFAPH